MCGWIAAGGSPSCASPACASSSPRSSNGSAPMDDAARLLAIEDIKIVKANYFLGVDTKDWDLLRRQVFCEQSRFDLPEMSGASFEGGDAIVAFFIESLTPWVTVHHGHTPIIEITSEATAT